MDKVIVEIPNFVTDDIQLADWLKENQDEYYLALEIDASQFSDRAVIDDIRITEIKVDADLVTVHYEFDYSSYYGCDDMNSADTEYDLNIVGERVSNTIVFDKFKVKEKRSTYDEL